MKNVIRSLMVATVVCGLALLNLGTASAQGYGGHGHGGHGHSHGGYGHGGHSHSYPQWHNTTHFDYHPGGFQRHGNHFHYVPGHYDLHRSGHWHP